MSRAARPDIPQLPFSTSDKVLEVIAAVLLLSIWVNLLYNYAATPDSVPIHFNARGEPDGWGSRNGLFLLPMVSLVLYFALTLVSRLPSRYYNLPVNITEANGPMQFALARRLIRVAKVYALTLFSYITWAQLQTAQGIRTGLGPGLMPLMLVGVVGMMIFYFTQSRRLR